MAVIRWTTESEMWLKDIHEYISRDNPSAAARVVRSIYDKVQILRDLPEIGYRYRTEEEGEKHLALLIHQVGEDARVRTKKFWTNISKNLTT